MPGAPCTPRLRRALRFLVLLIGASLSGCGWLSRMKTPVGEEAFPAWSQTMGTNTRGKEGEKKEAKPSGLLFDKRSAEIEKSLGGNF